MDESNSWTLPGHNNYCLVFARQMHTGPTTVPNTRHLLVDLGEEFMNTQFVDIGPIVGPIYVRNIRALFDTKIQAACVSHVALTFL